MLKALIIEGVNLDRMSVKEFNMILMGKIVYLMLEELSRKRVGGENAE